MKPRTMLAGQAIALLVLAGHPVLAQPSAVPPPPAATAAAKSPFIPDSFIVPTLVEAPGFKLVPLGPDLVKVDFDAYMSSIEHLQKTFSRSTRWPRHDISADDALLDMQTEQARFQTRQSFAYAVLTPDGRRERGSVYVSPSPVAGYDAVVRMWVTKAEYDAGFDAELYRWVTAWIQTAWPLKTVAYPGRAIEWDKWEASVAASKAAAAGAPKPPS